MKKIILLVSLCLMASNTFAADAIKNCADLKAEITTKLQAKGVKHFTLEILPTESVKDQKIVGSCARGTKKISYKKK
jgi:hypothetical protein